MNSLDVPLNFELRSKVTGSKFTLTDVIGVIVDGHTIWSRHIKRPQIERIQAFNGYSKIGFITSAGVKLWIDNKEIQVTRFLRGSLEADNHGKILWPGTQASINLTANR